MFRLDHCCPPQEREISSSHTERTQRRRGTSRPGGIFIRGSAYRPSALGKPPPLATGFESLLSLLLEGRAWHREDLALWVKNSRRVFTLSAAGFKFMKKGEAHMGMLEILSLTALGLVPAIILYKSLVTRIVIKGNAYRIGLPTWPVQEPGRARATPHLEAWGELGDL